MVKVVTTEIGPDGPIEVVKQVAQIITAEVIPSYADRMNAISLDNKMSGDLAPQKVNVQVNKKQVFKIGDTTIEF